MFRDKEELVALLHCHIQLELVLDVRKLKVRMAHMLQIRETFTMSVTYFSTGDLLMCVFTILAFYETL